MLDCLAPAAILDATAERVRSLDGTWQFCEVPATQPIDTLDLERLPWREAVVPGTVAAALGGVAEPGPGLDGRAFIYRVRFAAGGMELADGLLVLEGLATLADVRLNGKRLLQTCNMFRRYVADVRGLLRSHNELVLHFGALQGEFDRTRPRARWNVRMVKHRNLRYVRATLLGRMHGWAQVPPAVGPWRGVRLLECPRVMLDRLQLAPSLEGGVGLLRIAIAGRAIRDFVPRKLEVSVDGATYSIDLAARGDDFAGQGTVRISQVRQWWPHDLGAPHRYSVALSLYSASGAHLDLGMHALGFRSIEQTSADGGFALRINGRDIFCRGANWTPTDARSLNDDPDALHRALGLVRDAGFNMLRVNGALVYESDAFYEACDALGLLVWQDFMFARLDYPEADEGFASEARAEAEDLLSRIHPRACLAVLCGNSEVEQQAAMYGMAPDAGRTPLFAEGLLAIAARWAPGVPYVSSSPTGGALPMHVDSGVAHYFGVGAYLRSLADARESGVRFASECLAFSNVPEDEGLAEACGESGAFAHSPHYKEGVPRDAGAGWDFSDVTDHYVEVLFGVSARAVRQSDPGRYLDLCRAASGEMMSRTMGMWRPAGSRCRGALVWLLRDFSPGAGWGLLDSAGRPKAAYWFQKRVCSPRAVWFTDEGLNGLRLHAANGPAPPLAATLQASLVRSDGIAIAAATMKVHLDAAETASWSFDALLGCFADSAWAYRFGPAQHVAAVSELLDAEGAVLASACHITGGLEHKVHDVGLQATIQHVPGGAPKLRITTRELALFVRISAGAWLPSDNYFHVAPGGMREVALEGPPGAPMCVHVRALNDCSTVDAVAAACT